MSEVQYITSGDGQRTGVILPIADFEFLVGAAGMESDFELIEESDEDVDLRLAKIMEQTEDDSRVSEEEVFAVLGERLESRVREELSPRP